MPPSEIRYFTHHLLDAVRIKAAIVEDGIGAVIAGVWATQAACIGQFPLSAGAFVRVPIHQIISRCRQFGNGSSWPVGIPVDPSLPLEPAPRHQVQSLAALESLKDLDQSPFSLLTDDDVDVVFL